LRFAEVGFCGVVKDEDVGWFYEFFLNAGGGEEDVIIFSNGGAAACAGDLLRVSILVVCFQGGSDVLTQPKL
jgi:hypothetical protein